MTPRTLARAEVRVPATTANLGAGFDCVGVAVDKWLRVSIEIRAATADRVTIRRSGTLQALGRAGIATPDRDLIYAGFRRLAPPATATGRIRGHLHFEGTSDIPIARGLGSSAAAVVAGAALANAVYGLGHTLQELASACSELEGHGDNVCAATFGGAVLVWSSGSAPTRTARRTAVPLVVNESLGFAFAVPEFETRTALARAVLPSAVPFATAADAAARSAALVEGLRTANPELLGAGLDDVLHVPHRVPLVPHYHDVVGAARAAGAFGATLSGSGSAIVAIAPRHLAPDVADAMARAWRTADIPAAAFATGVNATGLAVVPAHSSTHPSTPSPTHSTHVRNH